MTESNERPAGSPAPTPAVGRVVVGVDGSPHSLRALDRAADEAVRRDAELEVVCGGLSSRRTLYPETEADRDRMRQATREVADGAAERIRERVPGLQVVSTGVSEPAAEALIHRSRGAELTVVGTRGHGGFSGLLLGSVSLRLAAHAAGPLMVVRGDPPESGANPGETVVGLKWQGATGQLEFGFQSARRSGSPLWVTHCWNYPVLPGVALRLPPKEPATEAKRAEEFLRDTLRPFHERYPDVRLGAEQHQGQAAERLIKLSERAEVIVLGVRRQQRRLGLQLGPVVHSVLHQAKCSVVLVPVS